jgi:hypothetical protein
VKSCSSVWAHLNAFQGGSQFFINVAHNDFLDWFSPGTFDTHSHHIGPIWRSISLSSHFNRLLEVGDFLSPHFDSLCRRIKAPCVRQSHVGNGRCDQNIQGELITGICFSLHFGTLYKRAVQVKTVNDCPVQPIMMESITISGL